VGVVGVGEEVVGFDGEGGVGVVDGAEVEGGGGIKNVDAVGGAVGVDVVNELVHVLLG
jgi:hypothetical protein